MGILRKDKISRNDGLEGLLKEQEQKILDFIAMCQDRYVIFDYDGTLTRLKYTDGDRVFPCTDRELREYMRHTDMYEKCNPLKIMQYVIKHLDPEKIFILTHSYDTVVEGKTKSIHKHYPTIKDSHIMHVSQIRNKLASLEMLYAELEPKLNGKKIIFVEDNLYTLLDCEEHLDFIEGVHISTIIA